jgi:hypothetical protein
MSGFCRVHVTLDMHTGLPEILNHNKQLRPPLGAFFVYQTTVTVTYPVPLLMTTFPL